MRRINNVDRVGVYLDHFDILSDNGHESFSRKNYNLFLYDVENVQDETVAQENRTAIIFEEPLSCLIDTSKHKIICKKE